jgi:hypothetical protein
VAQIDKENMDDTHSLVTHYAILIGINAYQEKPLKGCVRDIQDIETYLNRSSKKPLVVKIFTASENVDSETTGPSEESRPRPTYANVTFALEEVAQKANPGDFVYIHFSGHGTRGTPESEYSNRSTGDLALVLLDTEDGGGTKPLWGPRLALLLKDMVDKGLMVTLVLDCCFSASVYRLDDPETRFLPCSEEIDSGPLLDHEKILESERSDSGSRDVSMLPSWLINPDGYTILVACGPDEEAREPRFDGQRHGALSYCLLRTLNECGGLVRKHRDVYSHLRASFRRFGLNSQNPVLYGNKHLGFFGHPTSDRNLTTTSVVAKKDGSFELQAGQAHGVSEGDQFILHPFTPTENDPIPQGSSMVTKVIHARAFTSTIEPLDMTSARAQTGWMATPLIWLGLRKFPVRLDIHLPYQDGWLKVLQDRSLDIGVDADNHPYSFKVVQNNNEYEILGKSGQKIDNIPPMPMDRTDANRVYSILEHLARYNLARELFNEVPTQTFSESFTVQITTQSGKFLEPECWFQVRHDETVKFTFKLENIGNRKLFVHIYNLGPRWEVTDIYRGTYEAVPPKNSTEGFAGKMQKTLKLVVPSELRELGQSQCEDIIKVFITTEPTSFDLLELPKLGELFERKTPAPGTDRGDSLATEDWAALNFPIRTLLQ